MAEPGTTIAGPAPELRGIEEPLPTPEQEFVDLLTPIKLEEGESVDDLFNVVYIDDQPVGMYEDVNARKIGMFMREKTLTKTTRSVEIRRISKGKVILGNIFRANLTGTVRIEVDPREETFSLVEMPLTKEEIISYVKKNFIDPIEMPEDAHEEEMAGILEKTELYFIVDGEIIGKLREGITSGGKRTMYSLLGNLPRFTVKNIPFNNSVLGVVNNRRKLVDFTFEKGGLQERNFEIIRAKLIKELDPLPEEAAELEEINNIVFLPKKEDDPEELWEPVGVIAERGTKHAKAINSLLDEIPNALVKRVEPLKAVYGIVNTYSYPVDYLVKPDKEVDVRRKREYLIKYLCEFHKPQEGASGTYIEIDGIRYPFQSRSHRDSTELLAIIGGCKIINLGIGSRAFNYQNKRVGPADVEFHADGSYTAMLTGETIPPAPPRTDGSEEPEEEEEESEAFPFGSFFRTKGKQEAVPTEIITKTRRGLSELEQFRLEKLSQAARSPELWEDPTFVQEFFEIYDQLPDQLLHQIGVQHVMSLVHEGRVENYPRNVLSVEPSLHDEVIGHYENRVKLADLGFVTPEFTSVGTSEEILLAGQKALGKKYNQPVADQVQTLSMANMHRLVYDIGSAMRYDMIESGALDRILPKEEEGEVGFQAWEKIYDFLHGIDKLLSDGGIIRITARHAMIPPEVYDFFTAHGYDLITPEERSVLVIPSNLEADILLVEGGDGLRRRKAQVADSGYFCAAKRPKYVKQDGDKVEMQTWDVHDERMETLEGLELSVVIIHTQDFETYVKLPNEFYSYPPGDQMAIYAAVRQAGARIAV